MPSTDYLHLARNSSHVARPIIIGAATAGIMSAAILTWGATTNFDTGYDVAYSQPSWPYGHDPAGPPTPNTPQEPCGEYPASSYAVTTLKLDTTTVQAGDANTATVRLRTQAGEAPGGFANLTIAPADGTGAEQQLVAELDDGVATFKLPRDLQASEYTVQADYLSTTCAGWAPPQTSAQNLTVTGR